MLVELLQHDLWDVFGRTSSLTRLPLTELAELINVTWSPLAKVTFPASVSVDTTVTGRSLRAT
jgi:hypothetical protein